MIEDTYLIFLLMLGIAGLFYSVILRPLNLLSKCTKSSLAKETSEAFIKNFIQSLRMILSIDLMI